MSSGRATRSLLAGIARGLVAGRHQLGVLGVLLVVEVRLDERECLGVHVVVLVLLQQFDLVDAGLLLELEQHRLVHIGQARFRLRRLQEAVDRVQIMDDGSRRTHSATPRAC